MQGRNRDTEAEKGFGAQRVGERLARVERGALMCTHYPSKMGSGQLLPGDRELSLVLCDHFAGWGG